MCLVFLIVDFQDTGGWSVYVIVVDARFVALICGFILVLCWLVLLVW